MVKNAVNIRFETKKLEYAAYLLKAVVHPTRLSIIDILDQYKQMTVSDLSAALDSPHALISHHLNDMKSKKILSSKRDGQFIYYSIQEKAILGLLKCISKLE